MVMQIYQELMVKEILWLQKLFRKLILILMNMEVKQLRIFSF